MRQPANLILYPLPQSYYMANEQYLVYVEDDDDDLSLVEEIMENYPQVRLVALEDGQELMDFLEDQRDGDLPFLIVMDNNTPRLSGVEAASQLKKDDVYNQVPLVILTTAAPNTLKEQLKQNNIRVLTKPDTFTDWEALFSSLIGESGAKKK